MTTLEARLRTSLGRWRLLHVRWLLVGVIGLTAAVSVVLSFALPADRFKDSVLTFVIVGFLAQIIDGSLGMAYGVSSTTFLLSSGVSPAVASASVHTAQVFTTLVSGLSHLRLGNVDKSLFRRLLIPGMLGGVLGAYVLSQLPGDKIKPLVAVYLALMGIRILWKAFRQSPTAQQVVSHLFPLGIIGGFFDAIGGGGWGPIVTSTLIARGNHPRYTIGSVNLTEFFVTLSETLTFVLAFNLFDYGKVITGLILGGVLAAPMAAYVCKYLPPRALMIIVGCLIVLLSVRTVLLTI